MSTAPGAGSGPLPEARFYRLAMESLPDTVFVATAEGEIRWVCSNVSEVFGSDPASVVESETVASLLSPAFVDPLDPGSDRLENQSIAITDAKGVVHHFLVTVIRITVDADGEEEATDSGEEALVYACRNVTDVERLESELDEVFDRITDGFIALDTDMVITYANDHAAELFGHPQRELVGKRLWEFTPEPESTDAFELFPTALETGAELSYETYFEPQQRWYEANVYPSDTGLSVYFRDITDRVESKRELEANEARFRTLFEELPDPLVVVDDDAGIIDLNTAMCTLVSASKEELVGVNLATLIGEESDFDEAWSEFVDAGTFSGQALIARSDGERRVVEYAGVADIWPDEHLAVLRDVTERVEQAKELEKSESRFRALFEGTLDALVLADDEGRYVDANPAACELYGLPLDELLGKSVSDFAPPNFDVDAAWSAFLDAGTMRGEFELVRPDGDTRVTDFAARTNIRPGEHLSVLRDITERVERERQLEVQRDELAHLNHINRLVREVNQAIVGADTPDEVLSGVCRRLVEADVYQYALVATETAGGRFEVAAASGLTAADAELVVDAFGRELVTAGRRVTSIISPAPAEARAQLDADVFGCFPLAYGETIHGILVIGADRSGETPVLVGEEQHLLDDLGTTVGKAITSVTARRLLHADEVVTLEFTVDDADDVFNELSRMLGATVTVTALVPMADGRHACYLSIDGSELDESMDDETLVQTVETLTDVGGCRLVTAGETVQLEVHVDDSAPALAFEAQGTHVRTVSSTNGQGTLVVEVPAESNVRSLVSGLVTDYPDTRLVRKFTEQRNTAGAGYIGGRLSSVRNKEGKSLTEKQLAALRAAYAGGYYDWPRRGSSAQELAEALGVAPATYHQHLRAAEGKLVDAFFDS